MPDIYETLFYFMIYAFFGWCLEVVYQAVEHGKFINRGFLNGPYCPIYGVGVIIVAGALDPIKENIVILFVGSVILTSVLELVTGFVLKKIFDMQWWDYSDERLNLGGYICLKFSLLWGVACLVTVRLIHPAVEGFVSAFPEYPGAAVLGVFAMGFVSDTTVTIMAIVNIKKHFELLEDISAQMRMISDKTGEKLFGAVESAIERKEDLDSKTASQRQKLESLRERYKSELERRIFNLRRIEKAFPKLNFSSDSFRKQLSDLRNSISRKNK